jgi:hypothetical protein
MIRNHMIAAVLVTFLQILNVFSFQSPHANKASDSELTEDFTHLQSLSNSRDIQNFEALAKSLLVKWSSRDTTRYTEFAYWTANLLHSANFPDHSRQVAFLQTYIIEALTKHETAPLDMKLRLLMLLPPLTDKALPDWPNSRLTISRLWLVAWQQLDQVMASAIDFHDLPQENIRPPAGTGLPAGAPPSAIQDPILRAQYEDAIARNDSKAERFRLRRSLERLQPLFSTAASDYISAAYSIAPPDLEELNRELQTYVVNKEMRSTIIEKILKLDRTRR